MCQFDPDSHVTVALEAAKELPAASPFPFELPELELPELPDFGALFKGK